MTGKSTLEEKLERLAAAGMAEPGGRRIEGEGDELITGILREIDDIVLPRRLIFETPLGRKAICEVTRRRILRVSGNVGASEAIAGTDLSADDVTERDDLRAYFNGLIAGASFLRVTSAALGRDVSPADIGVSARHLADSWGLRFERADSEEAAARLDDYLAELGKDVSAWILSGGDDQASSGDADAVGELETLLAGDSPPILPDGQTIAFASVSRPDLSVAYIVARFGTTHLSLRLPNESAVEAARLWRKVVAR